MPPGKCLEREPTQPEASPTSRRHYAAAGHEGGFRVLRWAIERGHGWLNRCRCILVRWEKKPENYVVLLHFTCTLIAFSASGLFG